jgi:hypothetical protein
MKHPFTNATLADRRKGREHLAPPAIVHPHREMAIQSPESGHLPLNRPLPPPAPKAPELSESERLKLEVARILQERSKQPKPVPKGRLIGMAMNSQAPDPTKEYLDVLAMLMAKK